MTREEKARHGDKLKKQIKALTDQLDKSGRLRLKLALMSRGVSETSARFLMHGDYEFSPRRDLIESMEETLASFGKAKAS